MKGTSQQRQQIYQCGRKLKPGFLILKMGVGLVYQE